MTTTKKKPTIKKTCDCAEKVNAKLKEFNTCLSKTLTLNFSTGNAKAYISIASEKIDVKKRGAAKTVLATYCPFCGKKL